MRKWGEIWLRRPGRIRGGGALEKFVDMQYFLECSNSMISFSNVDTQRLSKQWRAAKQHPSKQPLLYEFTIRRGDVGLVEILVIVAVRIEQKKKKERL